ncbi:MAG: PQQ-binding-like beta-propeller repeat protein [Novosphingobium sp.]|nr:PQQ-binding-like beta-propeller repeat protein [Novosphingobium sp.]
MIRFARSRRLAVPVALALVLGLGGCGILGGKGKTHSTPTTGKRIPILSQIDTAAELDPELASIAVVLPPATPNPDWPQPGGAASKSYGNLALSSSPARIWTASIAGSSKRQRLAASPVIGDGQLFAMDTNGVLHAFDAATGQAHWTHSFRLPVKSVNSVFGGGASYDSGHVYVTTGLGEVSSLDSRTGAEQWRVKIPEPLRGAPTLSYGSVFVMTQNNEIYALNAADGSPVWNETASIGQAGVFGVAAPAAAQGTVIAGYSTGELVAYRYENGRQLWSDALARTSLATTVGVLTDIDADPIIDHGRVYALGQGGRMAAYELVSGQRIWELNLAGISTPAVAGDWIFALTDDARLLCIARTTGKVRWSTQLEHYRNPGKKSGPVFWAGPVLAGDRLWMGNSLGEIWSASAADGKPLELTRVGSSISLAPVVANATIYVLDDSGRINAFR